MDLTKGMTNLTKLYLSCGISELACSFTSNLECDTNDYESQPPTTLAPATTTAPPNTPAPTACGERSKFISAEKIRSGA